MRKIVRNYQKWYIKNIGKLLFLFFILTLLTLVIYYVPYINIIFTLPLSTMLAVIIWYFLFYPNTKRLAAIAMYIIIFALLVTLLGISPLAELTGNILYLLLILLFIRECRKAI